MKIRITALFIAAAILLSLSFAASAASPYYIVVNRSTNVVTVYAMGHDGNYTVPVRAFVCSTGKAGSETPEGSFMLTGYKAEWIRMVDGSYGQYCTQIKGNYLFHSVCYTEPKSSKLITEEYNDLGKSVSLGCVRLQAGDSKWIFDNCGWGTWVTVTDIHDDPIKPEKYIDEITADFPQSWDPTDPAMKNPWRLYEIFSDVSVKHEYYTDIRFAVEKGYLNGVGNGKFDPDGVVTVAMAAQVLYNAAGRPAVKCAGTEWYSAAIAWIQTRCFGFGKYPDAPISEAELRAVLDRDGGDLAPLTRAQLARILREEYDG